MMTTMGWVLAVVSVVLVMVCAYNLGRLLGEKR